MELKLDFATDDTLTGFRLSRFDFYNWGTYNNTIVSLDLNKHNGLLTGDIGSGKSTVVDALTTLLVPHQKIIYNKAAGAGSKERSLYSYIVGEYKSSRDENYTTSKAIALRDEHSFSVLLAHFDNDGFNERVTLAQFFYIINNKEHKFFVVSQGTLTIKKDFFVFKDIKDLKKRLRSKSHTNVYDSFKEYSKDFRRLMGIKNEQALNLFYQTVSLKEIGNLTSFIRLHMLEKSDIDTKVDELCKNFADLNHAHNLVLRAKRQIELLLPIDKEGRKYEKDRVQKENFEMIRGALSAYFAQIEASLLKDKIVELEIELHKASSNKKKADERFNELMIQDRELRIELENNGGNRLTTIESEIKSLQKSLNEKKAQNNSYNQLAKKLELPTVSNEHRFLKNANESKERFDAIFEISDKILNEKVFQSAAKQRYEDGLREQEVEILYLKNNRSNIPQRTSKIRDEMAVSLGVNAEDLPFVGELIQVSDKRWEGAIERVLHSFALSLLVEYAYYDAVASYVDRTNLRGKLVYLKVNKKLQRDTFVDIVPTSLINKIEIKADSPLFEAIQNMLNDRFNIPCVESMNDFMRFKKALTINGQFKTNLTRHEKDDSYDINNRSRWILGWDNQKKLKKLEDDYRKELEKIALISEKIMELSEEESLLQSQRDNLRDILKFNEFDAIDWYSFSKKIDTLYEEKEELETTSDIIKSLQEQIDSIAEKIIDERRSVENISKNIGKLENNISTRQSEQSEAEKLFDSHTFTEELKLEIDTLYKSLIEEKFHLGNFKTHRTTLNETTYSKIRSLSTMMERGSSKITGFMSDFSNEFPTVAKDFNPSIDSLSEYRAKLSELKKDDLPKWEKRFAELFKEGTIRNIVMIQTTLEHQSSEIKDKIDAINRSLRDIEYNDGTFIELIAEQTVDVEIREFKQSLKASISGAIGSDNSYDEVKFLQIKEIIDRFNGREGHGDIDKKWRKNVTDVRNWFNFSAMERYVSDGSEKEYYAHSGGKSGGQKEKLAYTVLASSLAFQFGIEYNKVQSRSFRFVMIDEAFGRGSDESTKYALRLFEKLKLQLLVITPKQKINIIEPFVKTVHFVHNEDGMKSTLISMQIEEYQKNKH